MLLKSIIHTILGYLLLVSSVQAHEMIVTSPRGSFSLTYDEQKISIKGSGLHLNMSADECNKHILKKFSHQVNKLVNLKSKKKSPDVDSFEYKYNGKTYYESHNQKQGRLILALPAEVRRIKLEEKYLCKK